VSRFVLRVADTLGACRNSLRSDSRHAFSRAHRRCSVRDKGDRKAKPKSPRSLSDPKPFSCGLP